MEVNETNSHGYEMDKKIAGMRVRLMGYDDYEEKKREQTTSEIIERLGAQEALFVENSLSEQLAEKMNLRAPVSRFDEIKNLLRGKALTN
jgi:hypothetical protein